MCINIFKYYHNTKLEKNGTFNSQFKCFFTFSIPGTLIEENMLGEHFINFLNSASNSSAKLIVILLLSWHFVNWGGPFVSYSSVMVLFPSMVKWTLFSASISPGSSWSSPCLVRVLSTSLNPLPLYHFLSSSCPPLWAPVLITSSLYIVYTRHSPSRALVEAWVGQAFPARDLVG